jgi:hypothetical protein
VAFEPVVRQDRWTQGRIRKMSETTQAPPAEGEDRTELKRVMGPKLLLLFIVGDILGTGV